MKHYLPLGIFAPLLLFHLIAITGYCIAFEHSLAMVPLHMLVVTLFYGVFVNLALFLLRAGSSPLFEVLARSMIFTAVLLVVTAYLANIISSYFWSQPMFRSLLWSNIGMVVEFVGVYAGHISEIKKSFPILFNYLLYGSLGFMVSMIVVLVLTALVYRHLHHPVYKQKKNAWHFLLLSQVSLFVLLGTKFLYAESGMRSEILMNTYLSGGHKVYNDPYRQVKADKERVQFESWQPGDHNGQNLVLIIVDALRGSFYIEKNPRPPFIEGMINSGKFQWIKEVYSVCPYSICGIMGVLGSKDFAGLHVDNIQISEPLNMAGYKTWSVFSGHPNWYGFKDMYSKNFDVYLTADETGHTLLDDDIVKDTLPDLDLASDQPFFLFIRLMSTHEFGLRHKKYFGIGTEDYTGRLLQADDYLKDIFRELENKGVLHNTTVLITGDHGEGINEKFEYGHNLSLYRSQVHVPILIYDEEVKYPQTSMASTMDAAPTLLDRAGINLPEVWLGRSLLDPGPEERILYLNKDGGANQKPRMRGLIYKKGNLRYKYLIAGGKGLSMDSREELYDMNNDIDEHHNVIETVDPVLVNKLRELFDEYFNGI
jgi:hypothetical protein